MIFNNKKTTTNDAGFASSNGYTDTFTDSSAPAPALNFTFVSPDTTSHTIEVDYLGSGGFTSSAKTVPEQVLAPVLEISVP